MMKKGNVITTKDLAQKNSTFEYDGNDQLIKSTNPKGGNFTYEYDKNIKNRLVSAVTATGLKYSFGYDQYGNATTSKITNKDGTGSYIETSSEYTTNGNYVKSVT